MSCKVRCEVSYEVSCEMSSQCAVRVGAVDAEGCLAVCVQEAVGLICVQEVVKLIVSNDAMIL